MLAKCDALCHHAVTDGRPTLSCSAAPSETRPPYSPCAMCTLVTRGGNLGPCGRDSASCYFESSQHACSARCVLCVKLSVAFAQPFLARSAPVLLPHALCAPRSMVAPLSICLQRVVGCPPINTYPVGRCFGTPPAPCSLCSRRAYALRRFCSFSWPSFFHLTFPHLFCVTRCMLFFYLDCPYRNDTRSPVLLSFAPVEASLHHVVFCFPLAN